MSIPSNLIFPVPKDFTDVILEAFGNTGSQNERNVLEATIRNLINEGITVNEIYNFFNGILPRIQAGIQEVDPIQRLKDTFIGYTQIWLPFQYGVLAVVLVVIIIVLMILGYLDIGVGIILIVVIVAILIVFAIAQLDILRGYIDSQQTSFVNAVNEAFGPGAINTIALSGYLNYVAASQLTVNGPTGPGSPGVPGFGPIILTDPNQIFNLEPPYFRVNVLRTRSGGQRDVVFPMLLKEPEVTIQSPFGFPITLNTVKPQYGKVIYVVNANLGGQNPTGDTGIIRILNATPFFPNTIPLPLPGGLIEIPVDTFDPIGQPYSQTYGMLLYPGECKCLVNVGYNQLITSPDGTQGAFGAFSTWVEVTSDLKPLSGDHTSNDPVSFPRIITRIVYLNVPNGATVDVSTPVTTGAVVFNQEVFLISNPRPSSKTINPVTGAVTIDPTTATVTVVYNPDELPLILIKDQVVCLRFTLEGSWILVGPRV